MDSRFLVKEEIDVGESLVREFNEVHPVTAAFWLKEDEDEPWFLYIAYDQPSAAGSNDGYEALMRAAEPFRDTGFDPFRVKLVASSTPLAEAVADVNREYPPYVVKRTSGRLLAGRFFEGSYIYPMPLPAPTG